LGNKIFPVKFPELQREYTIPESSINEAVLKKSSAGWSQKSLLV
jgi:hypothetical protein